MKKIIYAIICVLGLFGTLKAQEVVTIDGTVGGFTSTTSEYTPIYNNYEYAITQFYYTAEEIDKASGTIESIAFKTCDDQGQETDGSDKYPYTRLLDIYMINSNEYNFGVGGRTTLPVYEESLVFSGEVEFVQNSWIKIDLDSPFEYEGNHIFFCINDYTATDYVSNGGALFEAFNCNYDFDGLAYRALSHGNSNSKYDPAISVDKNVRQCKQVPFIQLAFAAGAEEYLEPAVPSNFKAEAISESKVKLSWGVAENAQSYNVYGDGKLIDNIEDTTYFIKNLKQGEYCYTVTSVNGSKESEATDTICVKLVNKNVDFVQVGEERVQSGVTDPVSSDAIPFGFQYQYSWAEITYNKDLFEGGFTIEKLAFDFESGRQAYLDDVRIYLAEKNKVDSTQWTAEEDLTLVFSDTDILIGESKWETFEFETPFEYKGENNLTLVVAVAKSGDNVFMNKSSWYFDRVEKSVLYRPGNDASYAQYPTEAGTAHYARPVVRFMWEAPIEAPVVEAKATSDTTVVLTWNKVAGATGYSVFQNDTLVEDNVDTTSYVVKGLKAATEYSFKVKAFDENGNESEFSKVVNVKTLTEDGSATTPASPVVEANVINDSTVVLSWAEVDGALSYNVYQGADTLETKLTVTTDTVTDLEVGKEYIFAVTAVNEVGESRRGEVKVTITVEEDGDGDNSTDTIAAPDTLFAEALSTSSIKLTWAKVENATSYNVYQGTDTTFVTVTDTVYTVENLEYNTEYCFAVTAVLNDTVESEKSTKVCVKTLGDGIEELSATINVYPNPVGSELFIATEVNVKEIAIYDIYGRQTKVYGLQSTDSVRSINVAELNSGIYFVKIVTSEGEIVKRFVKN